MSETTRRDDWVRLLAAHIIRLNSAHVPRVGIDGPDAAGKTTLADELAGAVAASRPVIRLGMDKFHRPARDRRRRGDLSPEGYYHDSFDYPVIAQEVLRPLGPGGSRRYRPGIYDYRSGRDLSPSRAGAPQGAVLIFDGVFLLRPELCGHWDLVIYLHVEPDETVRRAICRDLDLFGTEQGVIERYRRRYLPGQRLYQEQARPMSRADLVLDMNNPQVPRALGPPRWVAAGWSTAWRPSGDGPGGPDARSFSASRLRRGERLRRRSPHQAAASGCGVPVA